MLKLDNITKTYSAGSIKVEALKGVSLDLDRGEFVAVLGPSGCGKTTLLNIIGGLDRLTTGDLSINGRSTKNLSEREMDAYRNHSVGFVFQSYNLIPHQSVLSNVELALTLSGIGKGERRKRAKEALESVGLGDQIHKRPNQLSGGQMQRVAIARAMVNDPDILLADEPTGALDSQTSVQVLDLLRKLSSDRLVIMVTHNRELAERYASRIIELKDGLVAHDSKPLVKPEAPPNQNKLKKTAMGFMTALSLSLNNLMTKRGRTIITAFAGSIGIIGIALILAMSNGVNQYIVNVQKDTMSSYPITIQEQTIQMDGVMTAMMENHTEEPSHALDAVYMNTESTKAALEFQTSITHNNLTAFKAFLSQPDNPIKEYLSDIRYGYQANFELFAFDKNGELLNLSGLMGSGRFDRGFAEMLPFSMSVATELLPASEDGLVGNEVQNRYSLLAGAWPASADEVVLILDSNNEIADILLYQMGLITAKQVQALMAGEDLEIPLSWKYDDLLGHAFYLMPDSAFYTVNAQGGFTNLRDNPAALKTRVLEAEQVKVSGIVRLDDDNAFTQGGLGYPRALTDKVVAAANESPVIKAQMANESINVISGLRFQPETAQAKAEDLRLFVSELSVEDKASFAQQAFLSFPETFNMPDNKMPEDENQSEGTEDSQDNKQASLPQAMLEQFTGSGEGFSSIMNMMGGMGKLFNGDASGIDATFISSMLDLGLNAADDQVLASLYDQLVAPEIPSLKETYSQLGRVYLDSPSSISLYVDTFEDKEEVTKLIQQYNNEAEPENVITYTDYVALMISGVTTIINVISYVLIAFVAVSLVVSSIMIGIITYISVLERTKEIGILRAVGASRKDVGRVFTAEAFIIGLIAGILGIALSALLIVPINAIIRQLADDASIKAILPLDGALILIAISALLSFLAGWIPSRVAARKDPVEALRSE